MVADDKLASRERFTRRSATFIGALTFAARIVERLGAFGQIAVIASLYGSTYIADRWFVASIVPLILGAIAAEALSANLLPALVRAGSEAHRLGAACLWLSTAGLILAVCLYMAVATVVVHATAPAGSGSLALWWAFAPIGVLLGVAGVLTSALTYYERYVWPPFRSALASFAGFAGMLIAAVITRDVVWIAVAVTAGYLISLLALMAEVVRVAGRTAIAYPGVAALKSGLRLSRGLVAPVIGGLLGGQVFVLLERLLASTVGVGAVATLSYARGIAFTPVILAQAVALGVYPGMVRAYEHGGLAHVRLSIVSGLRLTTFLSASTAVFLLFFGGDLVAVLLEHGALSAEGAAQTGTSLAAFSLALVGNMVMIFTARVFYAAAYFRAVVWSQVFALGVYGVVVLPARSYWGAPGLAVAFGIAETGAALFSIILACRHVGLQVKDAATQALIPALVRGLGVFICVGLVREGLTIGAPGSAPLVDLLAGAFVLTLVASLMLWSSGWPEVGPAKRHLRRIALRV